MSLSRFTAFFIVLQLFLVNQSAADLVYSQTQSGVASFQNPDPIVLTFTATPAATSSATLTLVATSGELAAGFNKRLENLTVEGDTYTTPGIPGLPAGYLLPTTQTQEFYTGSSTLLPDPVTIPLASLSGYVADGQVIVSLDDPPFIAGGGFDLTLSYTTAVPEPSVAGFLALTTVCAHAFRRRRLKRGL